jgi:cell division protein FtsA
MDKENVYAVLDIGETNTKLVLGSIFSEKSNICGSFSEPTKGIEGGDIASKSDLQATISSLISKAAKEGFEIDELVLVLPNSNLNVYRKKASYQVQSPNNVVSSKDIELLKRACTRYKIPENEMVVAVHPIKYLLDDNSTNKEEPIGMKGYNVSLDAFVVTLPTGIARGYVDALQDMGIEVVDAVIAPLANASLLLRNQEFKTGAVIIDIGGKYTNVSLFYDGLFCANRSGQLGGDFITTEISKQFDLDKRTSEHIKTVYGSALVSNSSSVPVFTHPDTNKSILEKELVNSIESSLDKEIKEIIKYIDYINVKGSDIPVIISGGTANLEGIDEKIEKSLNQKCFVRTFNRVGGRNAMFNTAIGGLINYLARNALIDLNLVQI